jgi:transposase-like protein
MILTLNLSVSLEATRAGVPRSVSAVRRIELITGAARRRQWSSDEKARIVVESLRPGANVSEVARRNGLSPQQLFGWRRKAHALFQEGAGTSPADQPFDHVHDAHRPYRKRSPDPLLPGLT